MTAVLASWAVSLLAATIYGLVMRNRVNVTLNALERTNEALVQEKKLNLGLEKVISQQKTTLAEKEQLIAKLCEIHPDLAREYLRGVLSKSSASVPEPVHLKPST